MGLFDIIILLAAIVVVCSWLGHKFGLFFELPKEKEDPGLTIHNHIHETHNHLHVDKETFKELKKPNNP